MGMKLFEMGSLARIGFWAAILLLILMGWTVYKSTVTTRNLTSLLQHDASVIEELDGVALAVQRANAAHRGALISRAPRFATERDGAIGEALQGLRKLEGLGVGDSRQEQLLHGASVSLPQWALALRDEEAVQSPGLAWRDAAAGLQAKIAANMAQLRESGVVLRLAHRAERQDLFQSVLLLRAAAVFVFVTLLVPSYIAFVRQARARGAAEHKLRELAESLPGVVFQWRTFPGGKGRYEFLSGDTVGLRGVKREDALADPEKILSKIVSGDREELRAAIATAQENGTQLRHDYRVLGQDGSISWLRSEATQRRLPDGSTLWSGLWTDVTKSIKMRSDLVEAKEAAEAATVAKTNFVTTMSHEIRTPMSGVLGMLELLGRTDLDETQRDMLRVIDESGRSLLRIVEDILDFSKIEAGKLDLAPQPTSLAKLVASLVATYGVLAVEKGLVLTESLDERIGPALIVDGPRLRQVLVNLVANAIKFTPRGSVNLATTLESRERGLEVIRFTVTDTGIGISEEMQELLFKPFVQAETGAARYSGSGLGLVICRRLVALMGGELRMVSRPGMGTTMTVTMPMAVADSPLAATGGDAARKLELGSHRAPPSAARAQAEGTLLLLVDDHPTNRMILSRQVDLLGYAAEVAANGLEALALWRTGRFAMVITDCEMPLMDGYELARQIRAAERRDPKTRTAVMAYTAYAVVGEVEKCLAAGMDDYLAKPTDLKHLEDKLHRWAPIPAADAGKTLAAAPPRAPEIPPAIEGEAPIDAGVLAEVCAGDAAAVRAFLARFQSFNEADAEALKRAVANLDMPEVMHASHRMKGAGRTVGATALANVCERIERAARADEGFSGIAPSMVQLDHELERLDRYLRSLHQDPARETLR
jgi:signal transduction histidine kinase/HPt (histidine-containing phosphotransfer) domain-containing protein/ActR/RegA family two-component response regulator